MRTLLIDCHIFDQNFQGIRTFLSGLIHELVKQKNINLILIANDIENLENEFGVNHSNVKYIRLKTQNKFFRLSFEIPKIIKNNNCSHALFNYTTPLFKIRGCKYLTVIHDVLFLDFPEYFPLKYRVKHKILFKLSILLSAEILTVSEYSRVRINTHFDLNIDKNNIIPNAVDDKFVPPVKKEKSKEIVLEKFQLDNFILFVSRIETRKNHLALLNWYLENKIYNKGIQLVFVGKFAFNFEEFEKKINSASLESKGLFKHFKQVNNEELYHMYNAAKVAVFPSLCEGFGIPPLESSLLSTPTVCSNKTAMKDFDIFGEYHIDPLSPFFFAKIEEIIFSSSDFHQKYFENLETKIREKYNWIQSAKNLINIIES